MGTKLNVNLQERLLRV